jgi:hypothetical protein
MHFIAIVNSVDNRSPRDRNSDLACQNCTRYCSYNFAHTSLCYFWGNRDSDTVYDCQKLYLLLLVQFWTISEPYFPQIAKLIHLSITYTIEAVLVLQSSYLL